MSSKKKYLIVGIVSTLVLMLGFSLAYWVPIISGEGKKITVRTGTLAIRFTDTTEINSTTITPGWSTSKSFTVENESTNDYIYNISIENLVNTFVLDYLEYRITSETGYNMEEYKSVPKSENGSKQVLAYSINIPGSTTHTYTISFRYRDEEVDQSADMGKEFRGNLSIEEGTSDPNNFYNKLLSDNQTILTRTNFDSVFIEENTGTLYKATGNETEDTDGDGIGEDVYYFAGNAQNNWIKFGKDQEDKDLYWRIIRTNEDGSVRLLYVGADMATTTAFIKIDGTLMSGGSNTTGCYNCTNYDNTMYVGYMYGTTGSLENNRLNTTSSPIKIKTDEWYSKTINAKTDTSGNTYDSYVSKTAIYCNDRSGNAYLKSGVMYYAAASRLNHNDTTGKKPSYKCGYNSVGGYINFVSSTVTQYWSTKTIGMYSDADAADKFSVSTKSGGNGQLQYPIAQITADEISYAGGLHNSNAPTWYHYNSINGSAVGGDKWWTMSPYRMTTGSGKANVFDVFGENLPGYLRDDQVNNSSPGIRPVLSLKSCIKWINGNGSSTTPYEVSIDSTCALAEN